MSFSLHEDGRTSGLVRTLLMMTAVIVVQTMVTQAAAGDDSPARRESQLVLRGRVLLADGSPAAHATVSSLDQWSRGEVTITADAQGLFELVDDFDHDCRIHVRSADDSQQATRRVPAMFARTQFARPVQIDLLPALEHVVSVSDEGEPVEGAHVLAEGVGTNYRVTAVTGHDGTAVLQLPADERINRLAVWHAEHGVSGRHFGDDETLPDRSEFALLPTAPHRIGLIDPAGHPVPNLLFGASVSTEMSDWVLARAIDEAHLRSVNDGTVTVPWFPKQLRSVDIDLFEEGWHLERVEQPRDGASKTTATVRPKHVVQGRLIMPRGESAEGLLIQSRSFGPGNRGDFSQARAAVDGTFALAICSDHVYFLNVVDLKWASDGWRGMILATDDSEPATISFSVYTATPVEIRITRGPERHPVPAQWVNLTGSQNVEWRDAQGEKRSGASGLHAWVTTDADGSARVGLGRGLYHARIGVGDWEEQQTFEVTSSERQTVEFHRPWEGERTVSVRLRFGGSVLIPRAEMRVQAWGMNPTAVVGRPSALETELDEDGSFRVAFDAEEIHVFVESPELRLSGLGMAGPDESEVHVSLKQNGTFGGRLMDAEGQPLAECEVRLELETDRKVRRRHEDGYSIDFVNGPDIVVAGPQVTDDEGRFQFSSVPSDMPLKVEAKNPNGPNGYVSLPDQIHLQPGEVRDDDVVMFRYHSRTREQLARPEPPPPPLAERLDRLVQDARINRMHVLVVLEGDESRRVLTLSKRAIDYDESRDVVKYLTLSLSPEDRKRDAADLEAREWPQPAAGEIVLIALSGDGDVLDTSRVSVDDDTTEDAAHKAAEFVSRHAPPVRDAREAFDEAKELAADTGRRVWLVSGGPRCGPCFALARWMHEHTALLEKDYVILKVGICDTGSGEVMRPYQPDGGIPWHVIVEPDGTKLITSDDPLGNIGFPSAHESVRHFREMLDQTAVRVTPDEREQLVQSLNREN